MAMTEKQKLLLMLGGQSAVKQWIDSQIERAGPTIPSRQRIRLPVELIHVATGTSWQRHYYYATMVDGYVCYPYVLLVPEEEGS